MVPAKTDKVVKRVTMVATVVASYFLLTADYGPQPNAFDPVKKAILSMQNSVKGYVFGSKIENEVTEAATLSEKEQ
ncbi:hypothetical protein Tsubulata_008206 [Turnera subulata]|uniref:Uncharacterized protein n=1 Tax=Turnera subulata TaxID=218843 RepID=A0A9Q0J4I0_9ROSI|nr:hypothetical protein Tsubulata_008206 [Turnera subulata]